MIRIDRNTEAFRVLEIMMSNPDIPGVQIAIHPPEFCTVCEQNHPKRILLKADVPNMSTQWTAPLMVTGVNHSS